MQFTPVINSRQFHVKTPHAPHSEGRALHVSGVSVHALKSARQPEGVVVSRAVVVNLRAEDGETVSIQMEAGDALDLVGRIAEAINNAESADA